MKTVSAELFEAIHKRSRQFSLLLDFGDFEITKAENYSQEVISSPSSGLTLGTVAIGTGSFELKKQTVDVAGKTFRVFLGVKVGNEFEQVKLGKFTVTDVQEKGIKTEVAFEDDIALLDKTFDRNLTTPATAVDVLDAVASICGVSFDLSNVPADLTIEKPVEGFVCREIVGWIAQLLGTFVAIDTSTEKICFKWYEDTGYTINKDNYLYMIGEPTTDALFELGAISCNTGTETLTASVDNTQGVVSLSNPFMTQAKLNALLEQRKGFSYNGGELAFVLGNPLLDVWDVVTVEYAGKTSVFPCMSLSLAFSGAVTGGVKSFVRDANTSFEGTITKEINGIKTRVTVLDGILKTEIVHNDEVITAINASKEGVKIKCEHLDLEGQVTFSSLNDEVKTAIDTAGKDAEAAQNAANDANKVLADWCYENDKTVIDGGKVAAGTVTAKQINVADLFAQNIDMDGTFTATAQVYLPPTMNEVERMKKHIFREELIPDDEIYKYDAYESGVINSTDVLLFRRVIAGQVTPKAQFPDMPLSAVTVTINPVDGENVIKMEGTNWWGSRVSITFGTNGLKSQGASIGSLVCDTMQVTDNAVIQSANVEELNAAKAGFDHVDAQVLISFTTQVNAIDENTEGVFQISYLDGSVLDLVPLVKGLTGNVQEQLNSRVTTNGNYVNKAISWNNGDSLEHVILLFPVPQSATYVGHNFIDGRFFMRKTGGNVWDVVEVSANCVYGSLYYNLQAFGQYSTGAKLCVCTYNGIQYYAFKCPYHSNPYTNVEFIGRIHSDLTGGTSTVNLPLDVVYYNPKTSTVLNSEVYNSITETLTTTYVTRADSRPLRSEGGFTGNLKGNADTATKAGALSNYYTSRPASANFPVVGDGSVRTFKATSSMTEGKPMGDGHIIHCEWDNNGGFSTQLFIPNERDELSMQYRQMKAGTWKKWRTLWDKPVVLFDGSASNQLIQGQSVSIDMTPYRSIRVYYHVPGSGGVKETHMMYNTGFNQYPDYYYDGIFAPTPDNVGTGTRIMCMLWGINDAKTTFTVRRCGWFDNPSSTWNERASSDYAVIRIEGVI